MAMITLIVGSVGLFVAGFAAWYTIWHRRVAASFERVPVRTGRSVRVRANRATAPRRRSTPENSRAVPSAGRGRARTLPDT